MGCGGSTPEDESKKAAAPAAAPNADKSAAAVTPAAAAPSAKEKAPATTSPEISPEYVKYAAALEPFCPKNDDAKALRLTAWKTIDSNGNKIASLKDIDAFVLQTMTAKYPTDGETLYKNFRPSIIRAFKDAADAGKAKRVSERSTTEDFVEFRELRVCINYIMIYGKMFEAFSNLDGGKGKDNDDRKVDMAEFSAGFASLETYGFVAFTGSYTDPAAMFAKIDTNSGGSILCNEFCSFIEKAEQAAGTTMGSLLAIGDDEDATAE